MTSRRPSPADSRRVSRRIVGQGNAKEAPMLLSTFEHIVRGSLLNWWDDLDTH